VVAAGEVRAQNCGMTRNPLTLCAASGTKRASDLMALGLLGLAGCLPIDASDDGAEHEPVVGRLQFNDRVVDLTRSAFADKPGAVPRDAIGQVMADVDVRDRGGERE